MMARRLLLFLVHTNLWISLGVVSMYLTASRLQSIYLDLGYGLLIFSATLFAYTFHRILSGDAPKRYLFLSLIIAACTGGYAIYLGAWTHIPKLIIPLLVTVSYLLARVNKLFSVRSIDWLKPLSIAFAWAWVSVAPLFDYSIGHFLTFGYILGVVWSLCIVFDLKDMDKDHARGFSTLPHKFTESRLKSMALSIEFVALVSIISLHVLHQADLTILLYICILLIVQGLCILRTTRRCDTLWYYGLLDGLLLLPGIIFFL